MPQYFFDVESDAELVDEVGLNLPDLGLARQKACSIVAKYASDPANLRRPGCIVVTIRDGPASVLSVVRMICQEETIAAVA